MRAAFVLLVAGWPLLCGGAPHRDPTATRLSGTTMSRELIERSGNRTDKRRPRAPGPVPNPTAPWWLNDAPLQDVTGPMPEEVDVVIIGAGITGASVARHVAQLQPGRAANTLVVDARGAAGGATGRNGGMCVPMSCGAFRASIAANGLDEALAQRAMEYTFLHDIEANEVEADLRDEGYYTGWRTAGDVASGELAQAACLEHREQCADPYCGLNEVVSGAEMEERTGLRDVAGALFQPAGGGLWAARIVFALLEEAIAAGVTLRTRVMSVEGSIGKWLVNTDRGVVSQFRYCLLLHPPSHFRRLFNKD